MAVRIKAGGQAMHFDPHPAQRLRLAFYRGLLGEFPAIGYARSMRDLSDERLMQQYAGGDAAAFEELYRRYRAPLYRYFQRQARNQSVANDLYQGCWEKLIRGRKRFHASRPFRAWLFTIAHNHLVDHYRQERPAEDISARAIESTLPGPDETAVNHQDRSRFLDAVSRLPDEQKNALLLRFETGLGLEEIGQITGVSGETVKSRLRYASRKLKQALS